MKKTLGLLTVSVLSTALLTGCPGGSGGRDTSVGLGNNGNVNAFANENCNVLANSYTCTQTINGIIYSTPQVSFTTQQEFCYRITDNYSNNDVRGQSVAQQTRNNLYQTRCQGSGQPTNPFPQNPQTQNLKTFECLLQVRKGESVFPGERQQFQLPANGGNVVLFANGIKNRKIWNIINTSYPIRLADVKMEYIPALTASTHSMDQIRMSVSNIDNDISASVIGYAGSDTRIEINPQDVDTEQTELIASCKSLDALVKPTATVLVGEYACAGIEKSNGKVTKINYVNKISDVVSTGISITNSVFVQGQDSTTMDQGAASFSQNTNGFEESTVVLKSAMLAPTSISIDKLSYSLKVKCQPK